MTPDTGSNQGRIGTDRELLELAAKAAGITLMWPSVEGMAARRTDSYEIWNPLTDDGDALRLAVKLGFQIDLSDPDEPEVLYWSKASMWPLRAHAHKDYRRAIVRAAAEIGKGM